MKKLIAAILGTATTLHCVADEPSPHAIYLAAEYLAASIDVKEGGSDSSSSPQAFGIRVGQQYSDYFAIEVLAALGTSDDEVSGENFDIEMEDLYQFSVIGLYPHFNRLTPYLQLGVAYVSYEDSRGQKSDGTDVTYAAGARFSFSDHWGAKLEYLVLPEAEYDMAQGSVEGEAVNLGVYYQFSLD